MLAFEFSLLSRSWQEILRSIVVLTACSPYRAVKTSVTHGGARGPALPLSASRAGRTRLAAAAGVACGHRGRVALGAVAACALCQERRPAADGLWRPAGRAVL